MPLAEKGSANVQPLLKEAIRLHRAGRLVEAEAIYLRLLEKRPDHPDALHFLGVLAHQRGDAIQAARRISRAIRLNPTAPHYHCNLGNVFRSQARWDDAKACYDKALSLNPEDGVVCHNLAVVSQNLGEHRKAAAYYHRAFQLDPQNAEACSHYFHLCMTVCDWPGAAAVETSLERLTRRQLAAGQKTGETPFHNVLRCADPALNAAVARSWSDPLAGAAAGTGIRFSFEARRRGGDRITVGYLSNDFRNHPIGHLIVSLFAAHDRERFRIFGYSTGEDDGSSYRKRIARDCDRFTDIRSMSPLEAARKIHADGVHILVDLMGHTKGNRLEINALRPAPVQVTYLGFPGSSGAGFFDYVLADATVIPREHRAHYREAVAYLPHCYQVNDRTQAIADDGFTRTDMGLPERGFVFCSFNQAFKFEPVMFDVWMAILHRVPDSVLWLLRTHTDTENHLIREAQKRSIPAARLVFADRLPKAGHLGRLRLADLVLDTRIYNGHTSTSDALWAGVPVVALEGRHFASRVSAGILAAAGVPELITRSLHEYGSLAVRLAEDSGYYREIRDKVGRNRLPSPLFDTPRFARNLESAYAAMWNRFTSGEPPETFAVSEPEPV